MKTFFRNLIFLLLILLFDVAIPTTIWMTGLHFMFEVWQWGWDEFNYIFYSFVGMFLLIAAICVPAHEKLVKDW